MVRACRKDKITLRKVKHEMNARVAISRRWDMVRAGPKKVTELNPTPNTSTFFLLPTTLKWTALFTKSINFQKALVARDFLSSFKKY